MFVSLSVLDLTDEKGYFCGKILADLGCEVIKVEPVGGDPSRNIGPFYRDVPDPQRSLSWFAYNANKKGITLNIETAEGKHLLRRLVKASEVVLESFPPGYLDRLQLGYSVLSAENPRVIVTSITPFGQTGPYADYKGPDLVAAGMSGYLFMTGDADRPPVRMNLEKSYLLASAEAAIGTMLALYYREVSGTGQQVDVSIQASEVLDTANVVAFWHAGGEILRRAGPYRSGFSIGARQRQTWPCKDGWVSFAVFGGRLGAKTNRALVEWMDSEGASDKRLRQVNWDEFDMGAPSQELHDHLEQAVMRFFQTHTVEELYEGARKRGMMLHPVASIRDIVESEQLQARDFWQVEEHPELGAAFRVPGAFLKASEAPGPGRLPAPLIGEHNREIYVGRLGLSQEELLALEKAGVV